MMCHRTFSLSNAIRGMCLAILLFSVPSFAALLSQGTVLKVQKAFAFQEKEAWRDAIAVLREIETKKAYDRAYVDRMLGVLYWQTNDVNTAMRFLEKAVKSDALSDDEVRSAQRMLADLYLSNGNYKSAATLYSQLVKTAKDKTESAELWLRLAQARLST
ncbi:tetratricopeptide repeat protein [Enterovibrio sp. Hal110]